MSHGSDAAAAGGAPAASNAPTASVSAALTSSNARLRDRSGDRRVMCMPAFPYPRLRRWSDWPLRVCRATQGAAGARAQAALHIGDGAVGVELLMLVGSAVTGPGLRLGGPVWLLRASARRSPLTGVLPPQRIPVLPCH